MNTAAIGMSGCAFENCGKPGCPVCHFAGRDVIEIERALRVKWRLVHIGVDEPLPPLKYQEPKKVKR